jgi:Ca2+/H+ antiporter, TMEM165/GDT1 family
MSALDLPSLVAAFVITVVELTEVVALVFALGADQRTLRPAATGAVCGTTVIALVALAFGAVLSAVASTYLLWAAAVVLAGFAIFLFRSTLRSFRRSAHPPLALPTPAPRQDLLQFGGGFSVGAVETTEAVIVLLALAAAGHGTSALIGAVAGGLVLVAAALAVHERIRRLKVPWLKLGATALLVSYAIFWGGEAAGVRWPGDELFLIPMVVIAALAVRGGVAVAMRTEVPRPVA